MPTEKRILLFDPVDESRHAVADLLEREGFDVVTTGVGRDAIELAGREAFVLAIVALSRRDLDGLEISTRVKGQGQYIPVVFLSDESAASSSYSDFLRSADGYLVRPIDPKELHLQVTALVRAKSSFDRLMASEIAGRLLPVTDALTGLYNRRFLSSRLEEEFERAKRYEYPLSLLVIDLDDFKKVNTAFGFEAGDQVLKEVATTLRRSVRAADTVCRYGGEEFVALLPHTDGVGAVVAANRLRKEMQQKPIPFQTTYPGAPVDQTIYLTVSIGVAVHPDCATTPEELLRLADEAMAVAKMRGKDCVILGGR